MSTLANDEARCTGRFSAHDTMLPALCIDCARRVADLPKTDAIYWVAPALRHEHGGDVCDNRIEAA